MRFRFISLLVVWRSWHCSFCAWCLQLFVRTREYVRFVSDVADTESPRWNITLNYNNNEETWAKQTRDRARRMNENFRILYWTDCTQEKLNDSKWIKEDTGFWSLGKRKHFIVTYLFDSPKQHMESAIRRPYNVVLRESVETVSVSFLAVRLHCLIVCTLKKTTINTWVLKQQKEWVRVSQVHC